MHARLASTALWATQVLVAGGALAAGPPAAPAPPPWAHVLALDPPASPRISLTLDGRDWRVLPGVVVPLPPVEWPIEDPAVIARLRVTGEILLMLGLNASLYWVGKTANSANWELDGSWESWRKKLITLEGVSFDANVLETNVVFHPFGGALYYLIARGNDLGMAESLLFSAAASAFWETVPEYREKVSLNDLIFTPVTGIALGEPLHALGVLFERGEGTAAHRALAAVFSPFRAIHRWVDGRPATRAPRLDERGLPFDVRRRLELSAGAGVVARSGGKIAPEERIGAGAEIIQIPEYGRPGRVARPAPGGSFCEIAVEVALGEPGAMGIDVFSKTTLGGYYWQDIARREGGGLSGYSLFAGAATAFSYAWRDLSAGYTDKLGAAHLAGPSIDLAVYHRGLRVRAGLDAYVDFAAVRAAALDAYVRREAKSGLRSVLADQGYYFALGLTVAPSISVRYGGVELAGELRRDVLDSIDGLDRLQQSVTNEVHLQDRRLGYRARLAVTPPGGRVEISLLEIEGLARSGSIGVLRRTYGEIQARTRATFLF